MSRLPCQTRPTWSMTAGFERADRICCWASGVFMKFCIMLGSLVFIPICAKGLKLGIWFVELRSGARGLPAIWLPVDMFWGT